MKSLREKLTQKEEKIFGKTLAKEINLKDSLKYGITLLGASAIIGATGCTYNPNVTIDSHKLKTPSKYQLDIRNLNQENPEKYDLHGISIGDKKYFITAESVGNLGIGLFKRKNAKLTTKYSENLNQIKGKTSIRPTKGMYFLEPATNQRGKIDSINIEQKTEIEEPKITKGTSKTGITKETQDNINFNKNLITLPNGNTYYVIFIEPDYDNFDKNENNHLNNYFININGLERKVNIDSGKTKIKNNKKGIKMWNKKPLNEIKQSIQKN